MRGKLKKEGMHELFKTTKGHYILKLDDKEYYAMVKGQKGDIIVKSDSDHEKDQDVTKGKYYYADFKDDPEFQDMPHLFMEDGDQFREIVLPEGLPKESNYQKKLVRSDKKLSKQLVMDHVKGEGDRGDEKQYEEKPEGLRSKSKKELHDLAKKHEIKGRSKMGKEELIKHLEGKV